MHEVVVLPATGPMALKPTSESKKPNMLKSSLRWICYSNQ
jgi:hypothetical protein